MNIEQIKLLIIAGALVLAAFAGWKVNDWRHDAEQLAIEQAKAEFVQMYRESEKKQADTLQAKLDELKANERVVNHEITKVITRDVYRNECLDDTGVQLIERARAGKADTGKPNE